MIKRKEIIKLLQWAKRSLATALGDKKDVVKNWKIIKILKMSIIETTLWLL